MFSNEKYEKYENQVPSHYLIKICKDGKFAVTLDTANLRIRILENNDHRSFTKKKAKATTSQQNSSRQYKINKTVVYFKINDDLGYETNYDVSLFNEPQELDFTHIDIIEDKIDNASELSTNIITTDKWCLDISNLQKHKNVDNEYYIFVAVSHIDVDKYMKGKKKKKDTKNDRTKRKIKKKEFRKKISDITVDVRSSERKETKKGTVIYRLKLTKNHENYVLNDVNYYYSCKISGICEFVEDLNPSIDKDFILKRFILFNFYGIYNFRCNDDFNLNEKFDYPKCIRHELDYWYTEEDCMDRLLSCIYYNYFLVRQYKNNVELLEVYDLVEMKLETTVKRIKRVKNAIKHLGKHIFSISNLQLCFTQGLNSIGLYLLENGLKVTSKEFNELKEIHLIEFIDSDEKLFIIGEGSEEERKLKLVIWDLYNNGEVETVVVFDYLMIKDLDTHLTRTSGNLLQVNDKGEVISVLKKVENELNQKKSDDINNDLKGCLDTELGENLNGEFDESHIVHFDKKRNPNFKPIVVEIEPWMINNYERNSYCLYYDEREILQLIIGRTTVQIWHQIHNDEPFLEYIWINDIPVNQESERTRLRIKEFEYGLSDGSDNRLNGFYLKIYWYKNDPEEKVMEQEKPTKEKIISWKDISEKGRAIRHACRSLERLNKRRKFLANNYIKEHQYEKIVTDIKHIVWRFVKQQPDRFIMLDVRYNVMKNLILGDFDYLIKYILFGDKNNKVNGNEHQIRHIPRCKSWPGKEFIKDDEFDSRDDEEAKPENDMELAIYHCRDRELKDTIIIAYLLEYYCAHATDYAGWMCTVSKSLPLLFKYNYDDYARKLFRKECFADQDYFSAQDPLEIIPKKFLSRHNHDIKFRAFRPIDKLQSDKYIYKWYIKIWNSLKLYKREIAKYSEDFDNPLGKSPLALRMVPLPKFTMNRIKSEHVEYDLKKFFLNIFWFLFIPRWHKISRNDRNNLSPFSNVVRYEQNDDIYDNPATEAVIDFHWRKARNYFFFLFLRYLFFSFCFSYVSLDYVTLYNSSEDYILISVALFYYFAIYLFAVEMIQLNYYGPRKYFGEVLNSFDMSNWFKIVSIVLPTIVMSLMLKDFRFSDGFESVKVDTGIIVGISFSIFFMWIAVMSYLRLISYISIYIYYILIIFKAIFPFILFIIIVIMAFAHTMFVLLKANVDIKNNTISGSAVDKSVHDKYNVNLKNDFNVTDHVDNPYSTFYTSLLATYFWLNGNFVQKDNFDFWVIDALTIIASIILVIVLQNMLIAFMSGVYVRAEAKGRQALLRYRANHIVEYEALNHLHLWHPEPEPKYIYYIGQSKNFEDWYMNRKHDQGEIFKDFEEKYTFVKHMTSETTFKEDGPSDKVSIWKYDDEKNEIDEKYKENLISKSVVLEKLTKDNEGKKKQEIIRKEIQGIKKSISNLIELLS